MSFFNLDDPVKAVGLQKRVPILLGHSVVPYISRTGAKTSGITKTTFLPLLGLFLTQFDWRMFT